MTLGEKGLGAFLRDGKGYSNSAYKEDALEPRRLVPPKFIDKISLPSVDFVQVYSEAGTALEQAEELRVELAEALRDGNIEKVALLDKRLKKLMQDNGLEYAEDFPSQDEQGERQA